MLALAAGQGLPPPGGLTTVRVGEVVVAARPGDLALGIALAETAGQPRVWYGLGRRVPGPLRLALVRGEGSADRLLHGRGPTWGAGFALPESRTIIIRADGGDPWGILRHELAHLALHDAVHSRVPLWFDEGYAAVASGEWGRLVALRLNLSIARGEVPTLFELDRALRGGATTAEAAYALAASAVALLARRNPERSLTPLLDRLADGLGFDEAVLATTGWPVGRFEIEWQKDVRRRFGWLVWAAAGGFWVVIGVLLAVGVWYRRRRDRPRREALNVGWVVEPDEEPAPPLDQSGGDP